MLVLVLHHLQLAGRPRAMLLSHVPVSLHSIHCSTHWRHAEGGLSGAHQALAEDNVEVGHPRAPRREVHNHQRVDNADKVLHSAAKGQRARSLRSRCKEVKVHGALDEDVAAHAAAHKPIFCHGMAALITTGVSESAQSAFPNSMLLLGDARGMPAGTSAKPLRRKQWCPLPSRLHKACMLTCTKHGNLFT